MAEDGKSAEELAPSMVCDGWKRPYLVFGFDMGIASLGWCVLDTANKRVVALNVRLFDDPTVPKTGESLAG